MIGITHHAKQRINERGNNVIHTKNKSLYKKIKKKGVSAHDYVRDVKNTPLTNYLNFKLQSSRGACLMLYQNYIFVMPPNKCTILTTYPLPERYIEEFKDYVACGNIKYVTKEEAKFVVKLMDKNQKPLTSDKYFLDLWEAKDYVSKRLKNENFTKSFYENTSRGFVQYCIDNGYAIIELVTK